MLLLADILQYTDWGLLIVIKQYYYTTTPLDVIPSDIDDEGRWTLPTSSGPSPPSTSPATQNVFYRCKLDVYIWSFAAPVGKVSPLNMIA